jgi:phosphoenolpyruvate carboxykinase (ATP)
LPYEHSFVFDWRLLMTSIRRAGINTEHLGRKNTTTDLDSYGIKDATRVYWNLNTPELYEEIARRHEGVLSNHGALLVDTGEHTGRAAKDKAIVREPDSENKVFWGGLNKDFPQDKFNALKERMMAHAKGRELFVQDTFVGADTKYRLPVRVVSELAWHSLFARTMFISGLTEPHTPEFTIINFPSFHADPQRDGTRSPTFILMDFSQRLVLIGGTSYAGETKKSAFTIMNYLLPQREVMSMHCSANVGAEGDVAIFFGLSGTGKTTLSADPERRLIGDDEHGWSDNGVFNFEGGCYAKVIKLSAEAEPDIYRTTKMFGTILENVVYEPVSRQIDLDDSRKTENTRASYPLTSINNIVPEGHGGHPRNIIMLTADAFGVLPPVSRLSPEQAMYHFLSGYTAKVAGTERGIKEPEATFSTCFGAPFMVLHPGVYADLLGKQMARHNAACWLVNTGWSGGPYGVGQRMKIRYTRAMIRAILNGSLAQTQTAPDPIFGVNVPVSCPEVPDDVLQPRNTWEDKEAYDRQAKDLARRFNENFKKYEAGVSDAVRAVAPKA